ncbi:MAG: hypothetical protein ACLFMT_04415 [Halobacteriales archaeon]
MAGASDAASGGRSLERRERLEALSRRAETWTRASAPGDVVVDARRVAVEGVGPVTALYVEARTDGLDVIHPGEYDEMEEALNAFLDLYAWCHDVEASHSYTLRTAAEALLETYDAVDVARILTGVR